MSSLRHRFAGTLLLALLGLPGTAAVANTAVPTATSSDALAKLLTDAVEMAREGDSVGALNDFAKVFADPGFARLPAQLRLEGWVWAGRTAFNARLPGDARRYLEAALKESPDDARAQYALGRLLLSQGEVVEGARTITRALRSPDAPLGDFDPQMAYQLIERLQDQPEVRRDLLQVLFDRKWQNDGIEPAQLWLQLATLQADTGQRDRLATTLARIDTPMEIVALRTDRRFDGVVDRNDPRWDPVAATRRHLDVLRVSALLRPERGERLIELCEMLLLVGEHQQVLDTTQSLYARLSDPSAPRRFEGGLYAGWLLVQRARAEQRLGRDDATTATLALAAEISDPAAETTIPTLGLSIWYMARQQPRQALDALAGLDQGEVFGEVLRQWVRYIAYRGQGNLSGAASARRWLQDNNGLGREAYLEVLLEEQRTDEAAAWLIAQLQSPRYRQDILVKLQTYRSLPPQPGDAVRDQRRDAVLKRDDVRRAVEAVGRIETQPLHDRGMWR